jgi:hypothetical protein
MHVLIDEARSGSSAAPIEVHVRIDAFLEDRASQTKLLHGETSPEEVLQEAYEALVTPAGRTCARRAHFLAIGAVTIHRWLTYGAEAADHPPLEEAMRALVDALTRLE